ncbi:MAG: cyanophycin synthetase, partial [Candidatus Caenarcaniphilales bacterium]|nr:cyanophycin synthetase [Candidatus Caenarcaniphilales bacterium]
FSLDEFSLGLRGNYQKKNALLALNAYFYLQKQLPPENQVKLSPEELRNILYSPQNWPGRFQEMCYEGIKIVLDGAHNVAGGQALRESLQQEYPKHKKLWILGFLSNKDYQSMLSILIHPQDEIILTFPTEPERSIGFDEMKNFIKTNSKAKVLDCHGNPKNALKAGVEYVLEQTEDFVIVVSGSLYLVGEILEYISGANTESSN